MIKKLDLNPDSTNSTGSESKWLSMAEAASLTPYSAEYLSLLARKKKLSAKKIGKTWYTTKEILDEYMKRQMIRNRVQNGDLSSFAQNAPAANPPQNLPGAIEVAAPVQAPVPVAPTAPASVAPTPVTDDMVIYSKRPIEGLAEAALVSDPQTEFVRSALSNSAIVDESVGANSPVVPASDHPLTKRVRTFHQDLKAYLEHINGGAKVSKKVAEPQKSAIKVEHIIVPEIFKSLRKPVAPAHPISSPEAKVIQELKSISSAPSAVSRPGSAMPKFAATPQSAQPIQPVQPIQPARPAPIAPPAPRAAAAAPQGLDAIAVTLNEISKRLEKISDIKIDPGQPNIVTRSFRTVFGSKPMMYTAIGLIVFFSIFPTPFVFGFFDNAVAAAKQVWNDSNTVMGFRPGTHANEILLLDKDGNVSIMGHVETDSQFVSYAKDGVAPIVVDSKTEVKNLNAEMVGGAKASDFTLAFVTKNGNVTTDDVFLDGAVEVGKTLLVRGATHLLSSVTIDGGLSVFGDAKFARSLTVDGPAYFNTLLNATNIRSAGVASLGEVITAGNINVNKNIHVRGSVDIGHAVTADAASFGSLGVIGDFSAGGAIALGNPTDEITIDSQNATLDSDGNLTLQGNETVKGNLTVAGTINGIDANLVGTSTINLLVATNASTTNETVANLNVGDSTTTNATSTNLFATIGHIATGVIDSLTSTLANITTLAANSIGVNALTATSSIVLNATTTNATTTNESVANLAVTNETVGSAIITNSTTTNATTTNEFVSNLIATTAAVTQASLANALIANSTTTNATTTNAFINSLVAANATTTNLFATTASTTNLAALNALLANASIGFGTTTNATSTNLYVSNSLTAQSVTSWSTSTAPSFAATSTTATSSFAGNLSIDGNTTLGSNSLAKIFVNGLFSSNLIPSSNISYDIGSPSFFWRTGYIDTLNVNNISAASSSIAGTVASSFTINSDNVSTDAEDMQLIFKRGAVTPNALLSWNSTLKRFEFNQPTYIQNASTGANGITLDLQGNLGQTTDLFRVSSSTGSYYFNVANNGNVGIGTSSPFALLSVAGPAYIGGNLTATGTATLSGLGKNMLIASDGSGTLVTSSTPQVAAIFATSTTATSTFAGAVGIGTTSPSFPFGLEKDVNTNADIAQIANFNTGNLAIAGLRFDQMAGGGSIRAYGENYLTGSENIADSFQVRSFSGSAGGLVLAAGGANPVALFTNGTERARILAGGNFGIGTTSPWGRLSVSSVNSAISQPLFVIASSSVAVATATPFIVTNEGNVGVGTSSPAQLFSVQGNGLFSGNITAANITATGTLSFSNFLATGSSTLQNFTFINATGSAATTTNLFSTTASSTQLFSAAASLGNTTFNGSVAGDVQNGFAGVSLINANNNSRISIPAPTSNGATKVITLDQPNQQLLFTSWNADAGGGISRPSGTSGETRLFSNNNNGNSFLSFYSNAAERARFDINGNFGLGSTSPWAQFSINPNGIAGPIFAIGSSTGQILTMDNGGNTGINMAPQAGVPLSITRNSATTNAALRLYRPGSVSQYLALDDSDGSKHEIYGIGDKPLFITNGGSSVPGSNINIYNNNGGAAPGAVSPNGINITPANFVGIGTTSPLSLLEIDTSTAGNADFRIARSGNSSAYLGFSSVGGSFTTGNIMVNGTSVISPQLNGGTNFGSYAGPAGAQAPAGGIAVSGNVGIGTSSPLARLDVAGSAGGATPLLQVSSVTGGFATTTQLIVLNSGNVGIGTINPFTNLEVNGSIKATGGVQLYAAGQNGVGQSISSNGTSLTINSSASVSSELLFDIQNKIVSKFDLHGNLLAGLDTSLGGGNLGIGTTSPTQALSVQGNGLFSGNLTAANITATGTLSFTNLLATGSSTLQNFTFLLATGTAATTTNLYTSGQTILAATAGNVGISSTSPTTLFAVGASGASFGGFYVNSNTQVGVGGAPIGANSSLQMLGNVPAVGGFASALLNQSTVSAAANSDTLRGMSIEPTFAKGASTGLSVAGINIANPSVTGSGTITNSYGLYIQNQTRGTNPFSIYSEGGTNYFGGNVGVGTTSPQATLGVQGNGLFSGNITAANITATGTLSFTNLLATGSSTLQNFTFINATGSSATTTNFFTTTASTTNLFSSLLNVGTNALNVLASGNVGIGTATPAYLLDIGDPLNVGSVIARGRINETATDKGVQIGYGPTGDSPRFWLGDGTAAQNWQIDNRSGTMRFFTPGNVVMQLTTSANKLGINGGLAVGSTYYTTAAPTDGMIVQGNVGIGTISPTGLLSVQSNAAGSPLVYITKSNSGNANENGGAINIENIGPSGTGRNSGVSAGSINFNFSQPTSGASQLSAQIQAIADGNQTGLNSPTAFIFSTWTSNASGGPITEKMRLSAAGNLGIGTTSPGTPLSVNGAGVITGNLSMLSFNATSTTATSTIQGFLDVLGTGTNATSTFSSNLWVKGTLRAGSGSMYLNDAGLTSSDGNVSIQRGGASFFNGGNVGIGTSNPVYGLDLKGSFFSHPGTGAGVANPNGFILNSSAAGILSVDNASGSIGSGNVFDIQTYNQADTALYNFINVSNLSGSKLVFRGDGNLGIGTSSPWARLSVEGTSTLGNLATAGYFAATNTAATTTIAGGLDVNNGSLRYDFTSGVTNIDNLELGNFTFDTNSGQVSWADMPITGTASAGTVESYTAQLDGNPVLTVYGESDGAGDSQNRRVGIGSTTPGALLGVQGSGLFAGNVTATNIIATGTLSFTNLLATGSSTLQNFTFINATGSAATTTNFFSTTASSTNLYASVLGIATSSPGQALSVNGTSLLSGNTVISGTLNSGAITSSASIIGTLFQSTAANSGIQFIGSSHAITRNTNELRLRAGSAGGAGYFISFFADSELARIDGATGNMGISTTTPWGRLSVGTYNLAITAPSFVIASSSTGVATTTQFIVVNGNVGIGTSSPIQALSVQGNGLFSGDVYAANLFATGTLSFANLLATGSSTLQNFTFINATGSSATTTNFFSTTASSTNLFSSLLTVAGTTLTTNSSGQVGIGTNNPQYFLDIRSGNSQGIGLWDGSNGFSLSRTGITKIGGTQLNYTIDGGSLASKFTVSGFNNGIILTGGNVGIGTTTPQQVLDVGSGTAAGAHYIQVNSTGNNASQAGIKFTTYGVAASSYIQQDSFGGYSASTGAAGHGLNFASGRANFSNFFFRDSSDNVGAAIVTHGYVMTGLPFAADFLVGGNIGIGTTSPWAKLSVNSFGGAQPQFVVASSTGSGATTTSFIVDPFGNVGIGTSTPSAMLALSGGSFLQMGGTASNNYVPQLVSTVSTPNTPLAIDIQGNYAYVGATSGGFYIYDISTSSPSLISNTTVGGSGNFDVKVSGTRAYVTSQGGATLYVVDISNPSAPVSTATAINASVLKIAGRYLYAAYAGTPSTLNIVDLANNSNQLPTQVGTLNLGSSNPASLAISGKYAYLVGNASSTIYKVDISNPAAPVLTGTSTTAANPSGIDVVGNYAYEVNSGSNTLEIFNVATSSPSLVSSVATGCSATAQKVSVNGKYAYVTCNQLVVIDVSNPGSPQKIGTSGAGTLNNGFGFQDQRMAVSGRNVYVVSWSGSTLKTFDTTGIDVQSAVIGNLKAANGQFTNALSVSGAFNSNSLNVGIGGIFTSGGFFASSTAMFGSAVTFNSTATTTFAGPIGSNSGNFIIGSAGTTNNILLNPYGGNVGIGTTSPVGALVVDGGTAAINNNGSPIRLFAQNGGVGGTITNGGNIILMPGANYGNAGTPGYVGVGTAAPTAFLDVSPVLVPAGGSTSYGIQSGGRYSDAGSNPLTVYSIRAVPTVFGDSSSSSNVYGIYSSPVLSVGGSGSATYGIYSNPQSTVGKNYSGIFMGGNVGIGTTSPYATLSVSASSTNPASAFVQSTSTTATGALMSFLNGFATTTVSSSPTEFGSLRDFHMVVKGSVSGFSTPLSTYVSGRYAYVMSNGNNTFNVVDVSSPSTPVTVGSLVDATNLNSARLIGVSGNYAYVTSAGNNRFTVIDVSNPVNPIVVGSIVDNVTLNVPVFGYISGRYAYVAAFTGNRLTIVDISNPTSPVVVGSVNDGTNLAGARSVYVSGHYAYVAAQTGNRLTVVDVSNPALPVVVGSINDNTNLASIFSVYVSGRYAYVTAQTNNRLTIVDVSNPQNPTVAGSITDATNLASATWVYVSGRYAYVAANTGAHLTAVDVSIPTAPIVVGSLNDSTNLNGPTFVYVSGRYAYVTSQTSNRLTVVDLAGLDVPNALIGNLQSSSITAWDNVDVGNNLYVRNGFNVGLGGIYSQGSLSVIASSTLANAVAATFLGGNVGIGTTSPGDLLHIFTNANSSNGLRIENSNSGSSAAIRLLLKNDAGVNTGLISQSSTGTNYAGNNGLAVGTYVGGGDLQFFTSNAFRMTVASTTGYIGIGTTTPITKLAVSGADGLIATFSAPTNPQIQLTGSSINAIFTASDSAGAFIGTRTAHPLNFYVNGAIRGIVDTSGNFGIGTTTPASNLDIYSTSNSDTLSLTNTVTGRGAIIDMNGTQAGGRDYRIMSGGSTNGAVGAKFGIYDNTALAARLVIDPSGIVGIGTTTPDNPATAGILLAVAKDQNSLTRISIANFNSGSTAGSLLQFDTDTRAVSGFILHNSSTKTNYGGPDSFNVVNVVSAPLAFGTNNTIQMLITGAGNVGIGTTTPDTKLSVNGTTKLGNGAWPNSQIGNANQRVAALSDAEDGLVVVGNMNSDGAVAANRGGKIILGARRTTATADFGFSYLFGGRENASSGDGSSYLSFGTSLSGGNATEVARFNSSGNFGIATTTPSQRLVVFGSGSSNSSLAITNTSGATYLLMGNQDSGGVNNPVSLQSANGALVFGHGSSWTDNVGGTFTSNVTFANNGAVRFNTYGAGTLTTDASGNITAVSDIRLKDIQGNFTRGLADLKGIQPISYKYNATSGLDTLNVYTGFSAQNVQANIPEAVMAGPNGYLALQDRPVLATLVNAVNDIASVVDIFNASTTTPSIYIDPSGNIGIGTTTPQYKLHVMGDIAAQSFVNISTRTEKKDISYLDDTTKLSMLERLKTLGVATYRYNDEDPSTPLHLGLIAEESPSDILADTGKGVDIYKLSTFILAGVQEMAGKLDSIETRVASTESTLASTTADVAALKEQVAALVAGQATAANAVTAGTTTQTITWSSDIGTQIVAFFASAGLKLQNGIAYIENAVVGSLTANIAYVQKATIDSASVQALTVGTAERRSGITLYDQLTGDPYCLTIAGGQTRNQAGACPDVATSTPPVVAPAPGVSGSLVSPADSGAVSGGTSSSGSTTEPLATTPSSIATGTSTASTTEPMQATPGDTVSAGGSSATSTDSVASSTAAVVDTPAATATSTAPTATAPDAAATSTAATSTTP